MLTVVLMVPVRYAVPNDQYMLKYNEKIYLMKDKRQRGMSIEGTKPGKQIIWSQRNVSKGINN